MMRLILGALFISLSMGAYAGAGKLQETAGVTQAEGSGGSGLVPWATLSGYDTNEETSASVFMTRATFDDYRLQAYGASVGLWDTFEMSVAEQVFELKNIPLGQREIKQQIVGAKYKVFGDFLYSDWPQVSIGLQYKTLTNEAVASTLGAEETSHGVDYYIAMAKAHLGAVAGYNAFWNITLRATKANQFGLLGYGGDDNNSYETMVEASAGILLSRRFAVGVDYRQKPDNLSAVNENDASDIFLAYIPNKQFNLTVAWVDLGDIAGAEGQSGPYVSVVGYLW